MIVLRDAVDRSQALQHLQRAMRHACSAETTLDGVVSGAHLLDIVKQDHVVGAAAVRIEGEFATVTAFASVGDFVNEEWPVLLQALREKGVRHVAFFTKRPGMIRAMLGAGLSVRRCEMELAL